LLARQESVYSWNDNSFSTATHARNPGHIVVGSITVTPSDRVELSCWEGTRNDYSVQPPLRAATVLLDRLIVNPTTIKGDTGRKEVVNCTECLELSKVEVLNVDM